MTSKVAEGINNHLIKPIETRYKGYRFRSRLEARWAVFFDAMGLEWEYEPEGFDFREFPYNFGDNLPKLYLPDFKINGLNWYVEVKAEGYGFIKVDGIEGLGGFSNAGRLSVVTRLPVLMLEGTPKVNHYLPLYMWRYVDQEDEPFPLGTTFRSNKQKFEVLAIHGLLHCLGYGNSMCFVNRARSARFEHGESP